MAPNKLNTAIANMIENKIDEYISAIKTEYGVKVKENRLRELWMKVCSTNIKTANATKTKKDPNGPKIRGQMLVVSFALQMLVPTYSMGLGAISANLVV